MIKMKNKMKKMKRYLRKALGYTLYSYWILIYPMLILHEVVHALFFLITFTGIPFISLSKKGGEVNAYTYGKFSKEQAKFRNKFTVFLICYSPVLLIPIFVLLGLFVSVWFIVYLVVRFYMTIPSSIDHNTFKNFKKDQGFFVIDGVTYYEDEMIRLA